MSDADENDTLDDELVDLPAGKSLARTFAWQQPVAPDAKPPAPPRRRVRLGSHEEIAKEMRSLCAKMIRGEITGVDGNRQMRALTALANTMRDGDLAPQVRAITSALKSRGLMK